MARIEVFGRTEVGCTRRRNEDSFSVADLAQGRQGLAESLRIQTIEAGATLLSVCDGMGGAAGGDIAASTADRVLFESMRQRFPFAGEAEIEAAWLNAVGEANRAIARYTESAPEMKGMGTTLTAALVWGGELHLVHVGDSRAYLKRGRSLTALTTDHSVVGQMLAAGQLDAESARNYEYRNVLLQALGVQAVLSPELVTVPIVSGDELLLCSDGLTGPLTDEEILAIMLRNGDPLRCCRALTEAACVKGGPDNVTVVVARMLGEGLPKLEGRQPVMARRRSYDVK